MQAVPINKIITVPEVGKSMIIFMRPYDLGWDVQSSVFKITEEDPMLIGILASRKKVAYQLNPGEHFFMVLGYGGDAGFMAAKLGVNRTYFVVLEPRRKGWVEISFSLRPVHKDKLKSKELDNWLERCLWVEKNSDSEQWAKRNMNNIRSKYHKHIDNWTESDEDLKLSDGKFNMAFQ